MINQHPITPPAILPISDLCLPLELILTWKARYKEAGYTPEEVLKYVAWEAAQYGADRELEECCVWMSNQHLVTFNDRISSLRVARRPNPPSLKEQALKALKVLPTPEGQVTLDITDLNTIRRALEALPND